MGLRRILKAGNNGSSGCRVLVGYGRLVVCCGVLGVWLLFVGYFEHFGVLRLLRDPVWFFWGLGRALETLWTMIQ